MIGVSRPLLLDFGVERLLEFPDDFKQLDKITKDRLKHRISQTVLIYHYEKRTRETNPLMYMLMEYPHGQTLQWLEAFVGASWDTFLYHLRECLVSVEEYGDVFHSK